MAGLGCSEEEAREIYASDCEIDHGEKQDFDLSPEKQKIAQKFAHTGTRKMKESGLNLKPREHKENVTKSGIISALAQFLTENSYFLTENVQIKNKEREILFKTNGEWYTVVLTYKRNMNKSK